MKAILVGLVFLSSLATAKDLEVFAGGSYTCNFERKPRFIKTKGPFELSITQEGQRSSTRVAKLTNSQFTMEAKNYDGFDFNDVTTDFPIVKDMPVQNVTLLGEDSDAKELRFIISFQTAPYTSEADTVKCVGEPVMKKVPIIQMDCDTKDYVGQKEIPVKLRFALANLADPGQMMVLKYSGEEADDYSPIRVIPKSSYFSSLNENLSGGVQRDYVIIKGDSDGVYASYLRLNRPSLTQGVAWLEGDDEIPQTRRHVNCTVVGDVANAFDDNKK